ncbi:hypothetical protein GGQ64_003163 [Rhizobium azooxidifex]|uniref:Uncharacterized protein n=1 Tax=Mycoplana azooxidifex TaxID=1636188 RepID=A0A7W6D8L1_9HYPH|nr:hypothetical protein [Mycoplana azooxidifex]MBB3977949.1 hypothetical protein [Mycoplana azooxidifex]
MPTDKPGKSPPKSAPPKSAQQKDKEKRKKEDDYLDEALEETFPASDPIAPPRYDDSKN